MTIQNIKNGGEKVKDETHLVKIVISTTVLWDVKHVPFYITVTNYKGCLLPLLGDNPEVWQVHQQTPSTHV